MKTYQSNALNLSCKQNKMHDVFEKSSIGKTNRWISRNGNSLYLFFWDETKDNSDRTMNTQNESCQRTVGSISNEPLS